jgi:hypothetical protein
MSILIYVQPLLSDNLFTSLNHLVIERVVLIYLIPYCLSVFQPWLSHCEMQPECGF